MAAQESLDRLARVLNGIGADRDRDDLAPLLLREELECLPDVAGDDRTRLLRVEEGHEHGLPPEIPAGAKYESLKSR